MTKLKWNYDNKSEYFRFSYEVVLYFKEMWEPKENNWFKRFALIILLNDFFNAYIEIRLAGTVNVKAPDSDLPMIA